MTTTHPAYRAHPTFGLMAWNEAEGQYRRMNQKDGYPSPDEFAQIQAQADKLNAGISTESEKKTMSYTPDAKGIYPKYTVTRPETGEVVSDCFVLRIHDPHAREALTAYADSVEHENAALSVDIRAWMENYVRSCLIEQTKTLRSNA